MATPGQFVEQSMLAGFQQGSQERQAKQDAVWEARFNELKQNDLDLQQKYSQVKDDPTQRAQVDQAIQQNKAAWRQFLHPDNNPGVIQKYGKKFMEHLGILKQQPMTRQSVTTPPQTLTIPTGSSQQPSQSTMEALGATALPQQPSGALNQFANPEAEPPEQSFKRNQQWAKPAGPDGYITKLTPEQETEFQQFVQQHPEIKEDLDRGPTSGYDYRGWWLAMKNGDPIANQKANAWDGKLHGTDRFKTPYNGSFSNESMYALPNAPRWSGDKLMTADGKLVTDETPRAASPSGNDTISFGGGTTVTGPAMTEKEREEFKKTGRVPDRIKKQIANTNADRSATQQLEAAAPISPGEQATQQREIALADTEAKVQAFKKQFASMIPNPTPEQAQQRDDIIMGMYAGIAGFKIPEARDKWTYTPGHLQNGDPLPLLFDQSSGTYRTLQGEDTTPPDGWVADAKPVKLSNIDEEREAFRKSHGIPSGQQLDQQQEQTFSTWRYLKNNPLALDKLNISRANLSLREQEDAFKDFLNAEKALAPLQRIIDTAADSKDEVDNPSGPGDVKLTLAFFDSIKTQGVRFTKQEQDFIVGSRGFMDGVQARFDQGFTGTVFSPQQRALIAGIVQKAAGIATTQQQGILKATQKFKPNVAPLLPGNAPPPAPANNQQINDIVNGLNQIKGSQ